MRESENKNDGLRRMMIGTIKPARILKSSTAEQLFEFCNAHDACEPHWKMSGPRWNGLKPVMKERARQIMRTRYMHAYDIMDEITAVLNPNPATAPSSSSSSSSTNHDGNKVSNPVSSTLSIAEGRPENVSLIKVGSNIMVKFDKLFYSHRINYNYDDTTTSAIDYSPEKVIIENQISPIATRMKTVQGMVTQYFLMRGVPPESISYISATNKLKAWANINHGGASDEIDTYDERKKLGIACVRKVLNGDADTATAATAINPAPITHTFKFKMSTGTALRWRSDFESHKKKDDMADSLLQGLSYL
jgi:hypothetical protein